MATATAVKMVTVKNLGGRIFAAGAVRAHGEVFAYPANQLTGLGRYALVTAPAPAVVPAAQPQPTTGAK